MSETGKRILEGAEEALEIARGNQPAARIHFHSHPYVPENRWLPIDTAPKDGTAILVYTSEGMTTALWNGEEWCLIQAGGYAEDSDLYAEPTHWMPLPPPPGELT